MLSKSMRCTKNCSACSWYWSNRIGQILLHSTWCMSHNQYFKSWMNWATKFCLIRHIHLTSRKPTTTSSRTWRLFAGKCFHNQQDAENAFHEFAESQSTDFYATGIKKHLFLIDKNVLIVMVPILINKDVFEPSYNDLKFMVENCNYVCINLIISDSYLCQCCRL